MSDLQDLIHRNAQLAFEQGVKTERERIINLLEEHLAFDLDIGIFDPESNCQLEPNHLIELIKGEQK